MFLSLPPPPHPSLCIHTSHLPYPSVSEHLGCFRILAIVHNAARNIGVCVSFQMSALGFLDIYPGVELLDHMVVLVLVLRNLYCFPQWLHQFTFPSTVFEGSLFSTSLLCSICCVLFDDNHSYRYEVIFHYGFD